MKIFQRILAVIMIGLMVFSCGNPAKMAEKADQVSVKCNPEVLTVVANKITANVTINFPEKFFHPQAIVEVLPVIVYNGGELAGEPVMYQGEDVTENYKAIAKTGAEVSETFTFEYVEGMEKSHLELRMTVLHKGKRVPFSTPFKVADGANTTYMLVHKNGALPLAPNAYQPVIAEQAEAQVLYLINSSTVRPSQLKSEEIKAFQDFLKTVKADERREIKNTEIIAYASPDGKEDFNSNLSEKRAKSASKAFAKRINNKKVAVNPETVTNSIAEDWDGFQELVANSNISDKELILRVLEMYNDPMVREREIKNMSQVYTTLAKEILPQLRRARFITNIEFTNYTDAELLDLVKNNIEILDEEALLHTATLIKENDAKLNVYKQAMDKFNSDRAKVNAAITLLNMKDNTKAAQILNTVSNKDSYYFNTLGVIALRNSDLAAAKNAFAKSSLKETILNVAVLDILNGQYADAYAKLNGTKDANEALATLLNGDVKGAEAILNASTCKCAGVAYLKAIVAARQGNVEDAKANLAEATKVEFFANRAKTDIEFAKVR